MECEFTARSRRNESLEKDIITILRISYLYTVDSWVGLAQGYYRCAVYNVHYIKQSVSQSS